MLEQKVLEQQREIQRLKLDNFWLKNGKQTLRNAMQNFNYEVTRCACAACCISGRFEPDEDDTIRSVRQQGFTGFKTFDCRFVSEFNRLLKKHNLTATPEPYTICVDPMIPDDGYQGHPVCVDVDAHFENAGRCDWFLFAIGKRLWSAQSVDCDDLINYKNFIDELRHCYDDNE